jgi:hypothetical protein
MMRRIMSLISACALVAVLAQAGKDVKSLKPAPLAIDDGVERVTSSTQGSYIPGLDTPTNLNWFPVDSMANAFGPANTCTPLVYDPATNVVGLLHRGAAPYAAGSGQLWYNISRNAGATWRRVGELNGGAPQDCRYPSAAISNPANSSDTGQCLFVYVAPNLQNAGTWGYYTYGVDYPLGGGAGTGTADVTLMGASSSNGTIFGAHNSDWINWTATQAPGNNDTRIWRTNDYVSIPTFVPAVWRDTTPVFINAIAGIISLGRPSGSYYAMQGFWEGDTTGVDYFPFNGGYSKSTDAGATWGANWVRPQPDWIIATGLRRGWDLYDFAQPPGTTVSWNSTFTVDANGRGHFFHVVADSPWTEHVPRGILEVYETGTNTWAYKWVNQDVNTYTGLGYPGLPSSTTPYLDQTHHSPKASVSPDGQVMTLVWLDAATMAPADSFPDVWFSYRRITDASWSTPTNLTQTPGFPELLLHAAPVLKSNGNNSYTVFIGRTYQCNINTYPPDNAAKSTFYVAAHTFTVTGVNETGQQPTGFKLEQNYPNPFNPSTTISYSVAQAGRVSLKVFNTLGQEVATLVDENVSPGEYKVNFDASKVSSGVYIYKLVSGSRVESKKMLLLK